MPTPHSFTPPVSGPGDKECSLRGPETIAEGDLSCSTSFLSIEQRMTPLRHSTTVQPIELKPRRTVVRIGGCQPAANRCTNTKTH